MFRFGSPVAVDPAPTFRALTPVTGYPAPAAWNVAPESADPDEVPAIIVPLPISRNPLNVFARRLFIRWFFGNRVGWFLIDGLIGSRVFLPRLCERFMQRPARFDFHFGFRVGANFCDYKCKRNEEPCEVDRAWEHTTSRDPLFPTDHDDRSTREREEPERRKLKKFHVDQPHFCPAGPAFVTPTGNCVAPIVISGRADRKVGP